MYTDAQTDVFSHIFVCLAKEGKATVGATDGYRSETKERSAGDAIRKLEREKHPCVLYSHSSL